MGSLGVPRCHETAGNKEKQVKKDKEIEKEETKNAIKTATILWRFLLAIFDCKIGDFARFWPLLCPPIEVTAKNLYSFEKTDAKDFCQCQPTKTLGKDRENTNITKEIPCSKMIKDILTSKTGMTGKVLSGRA